MSLSSKIDFAVILTVNHANPNGDPLNGNRPRTDYNGFGEITDVCLKRKLRDRLLDSGAAIFVQRRRWARTLADLGPRKKLARFGWTYAPSANCLP